MPSNSYNTEGVPEPEVSATAQREKTAAFPDDNNMSPPRCYGQCIEEDAPDQVARGNQPESE